MSLRRPDLPYEGDEIRLRAKLGEGEHRAGIGRLVVLGDEFDLFSHNAARLVDPIERDLGAGQRIFPTVRPWSGDGQHHPDLDGGLVGVGAPEEAWAPQEWRRD